MRAAVATESLRRLWSVAAVTAVVGIALAIELTAIHVRVHVDPNARSFCTLSEHVSCDRVALSSYAVLAGVPLSLWGAFAYAALLGFALWGWRSRGSFLVAPFVVIAGGCAAGSLALAYVSGVVLRNVCLLCIGSWLVDWLLFIVGWKMARHVGLAQLRWEVAQLWRSRRAVVYTMLAVLGCGVIAMRLATPDAWGKGRVTRVAPGTKLSERSSRLSPNVHLSSGTDDAGHPYIGSAKPKLTIAEFADYQCPHCANSHVEMRELVAKNPDTIRIVHRHFPLDQACNPLVQHPFHLRACAYAKLAACAALMGKFWDTNDYLFDHGRDEAQVTIDSLAKAIGVDAAGLQQCTDKAGSEVVKRDIDEALQLGISGTPSFVVDGKVYKGQLPEDMVAKYE
jgi:uncharacterized membrane protein/predicted DsbA family dithiol-disulfide isomerase